MCKPATGSATAAAAAAAAAASSCGDEAAAKGEEREWECHQYIEKRKDWCREVTLAYDGG